MGIEDLDMGVVPDFTPESGPKEPNEMEEPVAAVHFDDDLGVGFGDALDFFEDLKRVDDVFQYLGTNYSVKRFIREW